MVKCLLSILMAVVVVIMFFSGCKKSEQSDETTLDISFSFEKVTLQFYFPGVQNKNATKVLQEIENGCREQLNVGLASKPVG